MKIKLTEYQLRKLIISETDYYECEDKWEPVCAKNTQNNDTIIFKNDCYASKAAFDTLYTFDGSNLETVKEGDYCSSSMKIENSQVIDDFIENVIKELRTLQTKITKSKEDVCNFLENVCYGLEGGGVIPQKQKTPTAQCAMSENDLLSGGIIRNGCFNDFVGEIQNMLVKLKYFIGDFGPNKDGVDKKYGKYSMGGVREFQKKNSLEQNGIMNKSTFNMLKTEYEKIK